MASASSDGGAAQASWLTMAVDGDGQLHLATCSDNIPHVSLMSYTYIPESPYNSSPVIVMTTNPASRKTTGILANPNVSLLVHDCPCYLRTKRY
jgi:nitroimidazol reductase NimA-like FMN-containing flavoprotein (pyridoxamine 5'-phosphate oxidase superfamily)